MNHKLIDGRYQILSELGQGGYGQVFKVQDLRNNCQKALKLSTKVNSLLSEYQILKDLQGEGIPRAFDLGHCDSFDYITMQLLGDSLYTLRRENKIDLDSLPSILLQCMNRIEYVHSKGYIHRDIKPHQFVIGANSVVYLLDFGISKRYLINKFHITFQSNCKFVGSCHFASINAHVGIRLSRRDDLESFVYSAFFMINKSLPWISRQYADQFQKWSSVFKVKREINDKELSHYPIQLIEMLKYIKSIKFEETPDYLYLKELIRKLGKVDENGHRLNLRSRHIKQETFKPSIPLNKKEVTSKSPKRKPKRSKTVHNPLEKSKTALLTFLKPPLLVSGNTISTVTLNSSNEETEKGKFPEFSRKLRDSFAKKNITINNL